MGLLYILVLIVLLIVGIPVAFGVGGTSILLSIIERGGLSAPFLAQKITAGLNNFLLLSVPLFLYTGKIMNTGKITNQIFDFAKSLVGSFHGGLGHVNVVSSVIFAGMTGTATSDAAGLGAVELKAMKEANYDDGFSVAITAASSTLGPIIPPSLPLVIYGMMTNTSIGALLIAGVIPGVLMAVSMMIYVEFYARRNGMKREGVFSIRKVWKEFTKAFWSLLTPFIIIGGIVSGVFTPTEAAAVAALYATVLTFVTRSISLSQFKEAVYETVKDSGEILLVVGMAQVFGYLVTRSNIATDMAIAIGGISSNPLVIGLILIAFLLLVGCFIDATAAITIVAPTIMPILLQCSIDPVQFGVIMVLTMMIGLITPPFGMVLFIMQKLSGLSVDYIVKRTLPFLIPLLIVDVLLLLIPQLTLWLPSLL